MDTALSFAIQASLNLGLVFQDCDKESEVFRQCFRQFQYKEAAGPREVFNKLLELCSEWLKPKIRSKSQMMELLTLEQYLTVIPQELETWVTEQCPETTESIVSQLEDLQTKPETPETRVVSLLEDLQTKPETPETQVVSLLEDLETKPETLETQMDSQEKLLEDLATVDMADISLNVHLEVPPLQAMEPDSEDPLAEAWTLQELSPNAAGEGQSFLDPGSPPPKPELEVPWAKELQDCKELEELLQFVDFNIDGNALLEPNFPEDLEEPNNPLGIPTEQLPRYLTLPVHDQNPSPGEGDERSNQEEPWNPRAHEQKSAPKKPHQCVQCGKGFVSKKVLKGHLKIHLGKLPHECPDCGKRFLRRSNLQRHLRVHTREAPYKCSVCEKRFTQQSHLSEHQKISSGQGVSTCPECKLRFCNKKQFIQHLKIHTNGKPHKCQSCGKRFRRQRDLNLHHGSHTAERPFVCENCGKSYRQRSSLVFHYRSHSGQKPYNLPKEGMI